MKTQLIQKQFYSRRRTTAIVSSYESFRWRAGGSSGHVFPTNKSSLLCKLFSLWPLMDTALFDPLTVVFGLLGPGKDVASAGRACQLWNKVNQLIRSATYFSYVYLP